MSATRTILFVVVGVYQSFATNSMMGESAFQPVVSLSRTLKSTRNRLQEVHGEVVRIPAVPTFVRLGIWGPISA